MSLPAGPKKFGRNQLAIEIIRELEASGRAPPEVELDTLAGYVGCGAFGHEHCNAEFLEDLRSHTSATGYETAVCVLNWMNKRSHQIWTRRLKSQVRLLPEFKSPTGHLVFQMRFTSGWAPFDTEEKRRELQEKLQSLKGWNLRGGMTGIPRLDLTKITTAEERAGLVAVLDWMLDRLLEGGTP